MHAVDPQSGNVERRSSSGRARSKKIARLDGRAQSLARRVLLGIMLRTGRGPLRPLWTALHKAAVRSCAFVIGWRQPGTAVYVKRSFAFGEPLFGISDVDMVVVVPGDHARPGERRKQVKQRWERVSRVVPPLADLVGYDLWIYEDDEFERTVGSTCFTYGLGEAEGTAVGRYAAYFGLTPIRDRMLLHNPDLYGPKHEWRLVAGEDRPRPESLDAQHCRLAAWLELQLWWRLAFAACLDPAARHVPFLCVKLVADPARILLWLTRRERVYTRREALHRALELIPDEEPTLRLALRVHDELHRSPRAPLGEVLPCFIRLSRRIAERIAHEVEFAGSTAVELVGIDAGDFYSGTTVDTLRPLGEGAAPTLRPLVDWRALARPAGDEAFAVVSGEPDDPERLAAAARLSQAGPYPVLCSDSLLVFPAPTFERCDLRAVQCEVTDPVSFALVGGRRTASFPNVAGWSARDTARRAVAECGAWLDLPLVFAVTTDGERPKPARQAESLTMLLSAARAALFLESIEAGEPQLILSLSSVAEQLVDSGGSTTIAGDVSAAYYALRDGQQPQASTLTALADLVRKLPAYSRRSRATV
jgi:hypothetical protein